MGIGPVILGVVVPVPELSNQPVTTCRGAWPDLRAAARNGEACDESTHAGLIIGTAKEKNFRLCDTVRLLRATCAITCVRRYLAFLSAPSLPSTHGRGLQLSQELFGIVALRASGSLPPSGLSTIRPTLPRVDGYTSGSPTIFKH